jgi:predicted nucleic acid-binding protein
MAQPGWGVAEGLDTHLPLLAAQLHRQHRLATADAIVYATALSRNVSLLTCDAHFADLPHVQYFSKVGTHCCCNR